jgi:hypothetical protein
MRALKFALVAAVAITAVGCNPGQPRIYRVAIDDSPLASLPPSCYLNNTIVPVRSIKTNLRDQREWTLWDGLENKQYLDTNGYSLTLGQADPVSVGSMIEGADKVFSGQLVTQRLPDQANPNYTYTKTLSLVITVEDLGAAPKGTIDASSKYTCTNCTNNDGKVPECSAKLNFSGRRVDGSNVNNYSP